jgi:hypothetical protein
MARSFRAAATIREMQIRAICAWFTSVRIVRENRS